MAIAEALESREQQPLPGNLWHTALSSFWFGSFFLWIPISTVLLQDRVDALVPQHNLQNTGVGVAAGIGGILAVTVPPIVGAWSDRMNTRFGRRRPIMVVGTLLTLPGLFLMMAATNYPELAVGYAIIQFFFNAAGAAYAGVIPDVVPAQQFGKASGFLGTMTLFGIAAGTGTTFLLGDVKLVYFITALVVLVAIVPTLWAAQHEGETPVPKVEARPLSETVREFLRPLHEGDLAWVIFTRLMVSAGITVVQVNLANFFRYVVLNGAPSDKFTSIWLLVMTATALPFGFFGGVLSDRLHRRKIFVYGAGIAQAFVALVFLVFYPSSQVLIFATAVAYGVGYGLYYR
ncbi:MAG TPA: MFS transporter, partial [Candidatus Dormibacteraeota bacterium]|nr:MFS transporter [Candidatus Dormibacteraeota bacterium]